MSKIYLNAIALNPPDASCAHQEREVAHAPKLDDGKVFMRTKCASLLPLLFRWKRQ